MDPTFLQVRSDFYAKNKKLVAKILYFSKTRKKLETFLRSLPYIHYR